MQSGAHQSFQSFFVFSPEKCWKRKNHSIVIEENLQFSWGYLNTAPGEPFGHPWGILEDNQVAHHQPQELLMDSPHRLIDYMVPLIDFMDPYIDLRDLLIDFPERFHGSPHRLHGSLFWCHGSPSIPLMDFMDPLIDCIDPFIVFRDPLIDSPFRFHGSLYRFPLWISLIPS